MPDLCRGGAEWRKWNHAGAGGLEAPRVVEEVTVYTSTPSPLVAVVRFADLVAGFFLAAFLAAFFAAFLAMVLLVRP